MKEINNHIYDSTNVKSIDPDLRRLYDASGNLVLDYSNGLSSSRVVLNRQTSSYTLVLTDADKLVDMNSASANNMTVPLNSTVAFPIGTQILVSQYGAGQTSIVATGGVTIRSKDSYIKLAGQYSGVTLIKIDTNEWYLFGDLVA